jgi:hypothetical protein
MGGYGSHSYRNIGGEKIKLALDALKKHGASIYGNNPWNIDTHYSGIKLTAKWDRKTQTLDLAVTDSDGSIPPSFIWNFLDNIVAKYGR